MHLFGYLYENLQGVRVCKELETQWTAQSVAQCTADIVTITSTLYCPLQGEPPCWQLASVGIKAASFCCRHQSIIGVVMCASEGELHPHSLQFHSIIQSNILSPSVNSLVRNSQWRPACLIPYLVIEYPWKLYKFGYWMNPRNNILCTKLKEL